jgi:hypothetical protein
MGYCPGDKPNAGPMETPVPGAEAAREERITMKSEKRSKAFRRRLGVVCCALIAAFVAFAGAETTGLGLAPAEASGSVAASERANERPITDGDVERYLPRLRADAAAFQTAVREGREVSAAVESGMAARMKLYEDMVSGKFKDATSGGTDVLSWMRAQTEYALIPPGAVYNADCTREVTADWMVPSAIFTFGKESAHRDLLHRATAGDTAALNEFHRRRGTEEMTGKRSAEAQAMYDLMQKTVSFYLDHGFTEIHDPMGHSILYTPLLSPDKALTVDVWEVNPYAGVLPRNILQSCAELPTGPMIEMFYGGRPQEEQALAETGQEAAGSGAAAEATDPEYERVKEALFLAYADAANPSAVEIEIPTDAPSEVKAKLAEIRAEFAVRRENLAVYRRHEAELAPVLEALLHFSEE